MARPSKDAAIDYTAAHDLTHGLLERAACPADTPFVLVRDADKRGLRLRVTKAGGKHWQFETRINGKLFTRTLGEWPTISLTDARTEAHRLRGLTEQGHDPRELERQQEADKAAAIAQAEAEAAAKVVADAFMAEADKAAALTVGEVWAAYVAERSPKWGDLHRLDHERKASPGGVRVVRGTGAGGLTQPGPLWPLMGLQLRQLDAATIEAWAEAEGKTRPTSARLAWRLLKVFLGWCAEQPTYAPLMPAKNQAKTKKARESLGKAGTKADVLQRGQLAAWFKHVGMVPSKTMAAALQVMLLTGARPGEVLTLKWEDVNTQWQGLTIRDKVEGLRIIPLTPYVAQLLATLPRRNGWVFASTSSASGHITVPNGIHTAACTAAGLEGLTLHGLRRSFKSLTEWLEIPAGVVAQLMGHKPSGTAEKHYTVRPLELLAVHHNKIEAWLLEQAGIAFDPAAAGAGGLKLVASA